MSKKLRYTLIIITTFGATIFTLPLVLVLACLAEGTDISEVFSTHSTILAIGDVVMLLVSIFGLYCLGYVFKVVLTGEEWR